ncbi:hypothetical protein LSAT2_002974 [Lamellibrachia satsuma]|nr:hypothetical protein LSAT2_002974 [Lamellibrachia satsuma]
MPGHPGIGLSQVTEENLERFQEMVVKVTRDARSTMEAAAMQATVAVGSIQTSNLINIGRELASLEEEVDKLIVRGEMIVVRTFLAECVYSQLHDNMDVSFTGFVGEDRCHGISEKDLTKRSMPTRIMCLIDNIGKLVKDFETVSADLELSATTTAMPAKCNGMLNSQLSQGKR